MRFLFACGGTAGHINPALAIAGMLRDLMPDSQFLFIGSGREMENRLIPAENYDIKNIKINGFSRGLSFYSLGHNIIMLKNLCISSGQSKKIIKEFKPQAVIGTGGYVCYPVLKAANKLGIPTFLHESNAIPGLTTKMLSDKVDKIMVAFPGVEKEYKKPERVIVTGTPVRGDFGTIKKEQARRLLNIDERPLVVSFWGSLGASIMNDHMAEFIKLNADSGLFNHIHATGGGDEGLSDMKDRLAKEGLRTIPGFIELRPYIENMGTVMAAADIVLCRAGASTIAELTMMGKPSILVPSPYVTNNHQEKNARAIEKAGGAKVITENECSGKILYDMVVDMIRNPQVLNDMTEASKKLGVQGSCEKIVDLILGYIK
jgi:UDP-N-acetylglucosamine--N-acetylmuramyl-(pentapeptide) pyrophosphoryl-undecaprenol N-acetylglucosamine transferase